MTTLIDSIRRGLPAGLEELAQLGRTLQRRRHDVLAYFDHHAPNGPTEAINGRLEALRRNASDSATSPTTKSAHYCTAAVSPARSVHSEIGRANIPAPSAGGLTLQSNPRTAACKSQRG
jgi:hypothetical protein